MALVGLARLGPSWSPHGLATPVTAVPPEPADTDGAHADGRGRIVLAWVALAGIVVGVLAGLLGPPQVPRNLLPALVVVGGPALLLASALVGGSDPRRGGPAYGAALVAVGIAAYAAVFPDALVPRTLAVTVGVGAAVSVAGSLFLGWPAWRDRVDALGLLGRWVGLVRRGGLVQWAPPAGAELVLGVLAGGFGFRLLRISGLWTPVIFTLGPDAADLVGFAACVLAGAGLLVVCGRLVADRPHAGAPIAASVPTTVAIMIASLITLTNAELLVAAKLLPGLLVDPLGRGWSVGPIAAGPAGQLPIGPTGVAWVQVAVLALGLVVAAAVIRSRARVVARPTQPSIAALIAAGAPTILVALTIAAT